jgi:spore maturation protein CgeB
MITKLLYFGPQWEGSTSLQRLKAFAQLQGVRVIGVDNGARVGGSASLWRRIRWKLRLPVDAEKENERLLSSAQQYRPDIVLVDNCKVLRRSTLVELRALGVSRLVYYSPDDIVAPHNLSLPLKWSLPLWDVVCTTKTFNVPELAALGVKRPFLIGKAFDPILHQPMSPEEVGIEFEKFDVVFIGTFECARCESINALADAGISIVVYGATQGNWQMRALHPGVTLRPSVFGTGYVRAWHTAKVALCFLRKINRDRITQRTMEIAAIGRPMVAERTDEHDSHFQHGTEYLGFGDNKELVAHVRTLLANASRRRDFAAAARDRCLSSGYSTLDRAQQMMTEFLQ